MNKLNVSTVSIALLVAFATGCSGSDMRDLSTDVVPEPGASDPSNSDTLVAELDASEETAAQQGIRRWEVRDTAEGRITRGLGPDQASIVEFAVSMNQTDANHEIVLNALAPSGGSVTLQEGKVTSADTAALGEQALALFQDATSQAAHLQPAAENETEPGDGAATTGTLRSALSAGTFNVDTKEVAYDGGCTARTQAKLIVGSLASDLTTTTFVRSPYLFSGCQAKIQPVFPTSFGIVFFGPSYLAGACAILDPGCAPFRQTGPLHFADPVSFGLIPFVTTFNVEQSKG